jgi:HD-GYP domain-containing protein (c-di-GMP phosphodiesterase class II)/DNA-binding CsgD family transcriptional regulator
VRVAEIVGALSFASDVSSGLTMEKGIRTVVIATRLARAVGATADPTAVFWVSALRFVGCTAFGPEESAWAGGDDRSVRRTLVYVDWDRPADSLRRIARGFAPEASTLERAAGIARFVTDRSAPRRFARTHCEAGSFFARTLGMTEDVARGLDVTGERFDGKGIRRVRGDEIPLAARIADVADVLELFWWSDGSELAHAILEQRKGKTLDPALVDAALACSGDLTDGLRDGSAWDAYLAAEPSPLVASGEQIDSGCVALGRLADLTSLHTLVHSRRVAMLADTAAACAGVPDEERRALRRAACVHDLGRVSVSCGTWDKKGTLNAIEWQRVREHSRQTEIILRAAGLDELAAIAGATHERGRGNGYHKGVALDRVSFLAKILAAADVMAALGEERPHRGAHHESSAVRELRALVGNGAIDARAAQAVLDACVGAPRGRKGVWPGGLSDREVEVVRLVAIGRTNKEVAATLGISPRTAQKHVMNVYDKLGLESRAGLALYAVENGLLDDP